MTRKRTPLRRGIARASLTLVAAVVASQGMGGALPAGAANPAAEQMTFGTRMAQRGLWSEALFRFRQASLLDPQNVRALSNLAVAYEALGRFDEAAATYEQALKLGPGNADVKRNQSRFLEFYQGFKGRAQAPAVGPGQEIAPVKPEPPPPASPPPAVPSPPGEER